MKKCHRNVWNASNCFSTISHESSISFGVAWEIKEARESVRDEERYGGVRKSIHQSWMAKGLGLELGLLCWCFKGVQEWIPSEEARTLQIGSVAFPPGQCTCLQLHPCHKLFHQDGHQDSSPAFPVTFGYSLSS